MPRDRNTRDTATPSPVPPGERPWEQLQLVILTILFHPRVERIGEVALLEGLDKDGIASLSRTKLAFAQPGSDDTQPLLDPFVSRKSIIISRAGKNLRIQPPDGGTMSVDGIEIDGPTLLEPMAMGRGVVLELGRRVVLLLQRTTVLDPREPSTQIDGLIGESAAMRALRSRIIRVARFDVPVLVCGESGSGKEGVARALHDRSTRSDGPFISVNMAALTPSLAASALFGHTRGAFTGAAGKSDGFFGAANGGTLFLDEVGDTPAEIQPALLRALETGELQRPGAPTPPKVDVRVVAATDVDLQAAVRHGDFRRSLLHRLSGYQLETPPLRLRRADIGRLLMCFVQEELHNVGAQHKTALANSRDWPWLGADLVSRLCRYDWPGNVRELRNVSRRIVISSVDLDHVNESEVLDLLESTQHLEHLAPPLATAPPEVSPKSPARAADALTENHVRDTLRKHRFRVSAAARELGVSRTTLYAAIERFPGVRKAADLAETEVTAALRESGGDLTQAAEALEVSLHALKMRIADLELDT